MAAMGKTETPIRWQDLSYLRKGSERQRAAYHALQSRGVLDELQGFSPVLVGTIPLAIDVDDSDLDIVCEAHDLVEFERRVTGAFGQRDEFRIKQKLIKGVPSVVASFLHAGFRVEIFGQPQPVAEQHAYRHMVVEARLLDIGGKDARRAIRSLKRDGLKTEPAFARHFNFDGDPYEVLLELSRLSIDELKTLVTSRV
jgi:hypothetical protein